MRVLVVDDEEMIVRVLARALRRHGFEVTTAVSGEGALAVVDAPRLDVVLSDVRMPGIDGPSLLTQLRARGVVVPVVFLTGYAGHSYDALMALGASAVLGKPVDIGTLVEVLTSVTRP